MGDNDRERVSMTGAERRESRRQPAVKFIWYKVMEEGSEKPDYITEGISKMCDISATGMGIYVTHELPVGKLIFLEVAAREFGISAVGEIVNVRRKDAKYHRVGIRFIVIPPNDRLKLGEFLRSDGKD